MRIKIISKNNNPLECKVLNAETGEQIQNVVSCDININARTMNYSAILYIRDFDLEFEADMKRVNDFTGHVIPEDKLI